MFALQLPKVSRQVLGADIQVLGEVLHDGVNLAVWQRRLPAQIADFADALLAQGEPLAHSMTLEMCIRDRS